MRGNKVVDRAASVAFQPREALNCGEHKAKAKGTGRKQKEELLETFRRWKVENPALCVTNRIYLK